MRSTLSGCSVTENRWAPTIERGTTLFYINKLAGTSIKLSDDWYKHERKKNHLHSSCYHRKYVSRHCDQDRDEYLEIEWNVTTLLPATERLSRTIRNLPKLPQEARHRDDSKADSQRDYVLKIFLHRKQNRKQTSISDTCQCLSS